MTTSHKHPSSDSKRKQQNIDGTPRGKRPQLATKSIGDQQQYTRKEKNFEESWKKVTGKEEDQ